MRRILSCLSAATLTLAGLTLVSGPASAAPTSRQQVYADAAAEFGVPESVLLGVSYLESRWDRNAGKPSTSGGFGPMHLTDAANVRAVSHHDSGTEDPRGDDSRPLTVRAATPAAPLAASLQTIDAAAALTGAPKEALRTDATANIRGGAALLGSYQKALGAPTGAGSDPAAWYGAVARYSGADTTDAATAFADEVYATIESGAARTTDDGQAVRLEGRSVAPQRAQANRLGLRAAPRADGVECPVTVSCEWIPAPYEAFGDGDYGNHDLSDRPARQKIEYIIIHDTEGSYATTLNLVQDPTYVSWHYTLRSVDGHIAQHVKTKDVAWHAGNWDVNARSVGLEHEGFAADGAWYTEALYRSSAKLVRYLAHRFGIPLNRQHVLGHDNVPGTTAATVRGMHWDPGPYWDWSHYFDLLGAPFWSTGTALTGLVQIDPSYVDNQPAFTGCVTAGVPCAPHGSSSVVLHTAPSFDAPLVTDLGLHPDGAPSTMHISDHGARASAGQTYALAGRSGDWTAIWYLGQKGWFHNPRSAPTANWQIGLVAVPKKDKATIPVYGRAYPEAEAYPAGVPVQAISPLQYTLSAGQRYAVGAVLPGQYYRATTFAGTSPGDWTVIQGDKTYVEIQFGHRVAFVDKADVDLRLSIGS
ncbi:peptidoglycan recognition family protein [Asanoa sp. WMMD1127]|uniref:N-acetylmuramoyl-L-alanine amidase n=1 Tax=Asanoa sp. WMMD1127 TaxID=3016107 RepID=UPI00241621B8|nr:peptidoglycan recognition family protein [Asanoa sp. WMMD1127]MDG4826316.1 peptidoglycan recognition family protein [Asanoa sp. WMMD1127]